MYRVLRSLLFALPPDMAHAIAMTALAPVEHVGLVRALVRALASAPSDPRIETELLGLKFPSPIGLAAGFDKNARRPRALAALGFGHLELGTVTARGQDPNPSPHLFRLPKDRALVNRLGFPNDGAEHVARRLASTRRAIAVPLGISIGKSRVVPADAIDQVVTDYVATFDRVSPLADFVVVNVSSPNTTGLRNLQAREQSHALLSALRDRARSSRLLVKIAPDLDDAQLDDILSVVDAVRIDGVVATNTTVSRDGLSTSAERVEAIGAGGLSGAPLKSRSLAMVRRVRARLGPRAAIIGVGGVERTEDVIAMLRAGANLVQMYTGFVYEGPFVAAKIARELVRAVERERASHVTALASSTT